MSAPKTIAEVEQLNFLIKNYKEAVKLNYEIIPNLNEIYGGFPRHVLPFNAELHAAITKAGQEGLRNLIKRLEEYGIECGSTADDVEIKSRALINI